MGMDRWEYFLERRRSKGPANEQPILSVARVGATVGHIVCSYGCGGYVVLHKCDAAYVRSAVPVQRGPDWWAVGRRSPPWAHWLLRTGLRRPHCLAMQSAEWLCLVQLAQQLRCRHVVLLHKR